MIVRLLECFVPSQAISGPILIGENNLIEEQVQIVNEDPQAVKEGRVPVMIIGNNNVFEVQCL